MSFKLEGIPRDKVAEIWPQVSSYLLPAIDDYSDLTEAHVLKGLNEGMLQLCIARDGDTIAAAAVLESIKAPALNQDVAFNKLDIVLLGGSDYKQWIYFVDNIANWAKQSGCQIIECRSRKGFERVLKPYGFEAQAVILRRKL